MSKGGLVDHILFLGARVAVPHPALLCPPSTASPLPAPPLPSDTAHPPAARGRSFEKCRGRVAGSNFDGRSDITSRAGRGTHDDGSDEVERDGEYDHGLARRGFALSCSSGPSGRLPLHLVRLVLLDGDPLVVLTRHAVELCRATGRSRESEREWWVGEEEEVQHTMRRAPGQLVTITLIPVKQDIDACRTFSTTQRTRLRTLARPRHGSNATSPISSQLRISTLRNPRSRLELGRTLCSNPLIAGKPILSPQLALLV